jgi:hypothetical protein
MPATYSNRRTYEQITGGGRSAWKMPGSEKTEELKIFGIDVDGSTFRKYNHENYTIGFCFCDLAAVERWATDPDRAARFPERAAEAKQIMEQIIAEITGKDMKTMKDPRTAAGFIDALKDIYNESRANYDSLQTNVEKARAKMERAQQDTQDPNKNHQIAEAKYFIAKGEYQLAEDEARSGYYKMEEDHNAKVKELREQFAAYLADHYSATPDKLDNATMALLNSGICTPSELGRLIERHKDNHTMLRIVGNYARNMREEKKNSLSHGDQVICSSVAHAANLAKDGSRELAIFDSAVSAAAYGLGREYEHATRMHGHVSGWLDDFKNQIANLPLTPAVEAPVVGGDE